MVGFDGENSIEFLGNYNYSQITLHATLIVMGYYRDDLENTAIINMDSNKLFLVQKLNILNF